ncbi:MAG: metal-dependent transcriptional regulator [Oscillospiraceae bacterium]|nr:metal-dependent transcriptional regulator [Oscillospiraceae bacterium]
MKIHEKTHESAENYLETILILGGVENSEKKKVRSIDIVNELGLTKPSISVAMRKLRENGYITICDCGYITLTESGQRIAESMYERHTLISDWLISLGVDRQVALNDACKMEHCMSEQSFLAIKDCILKRK